MTFNLELQGSAHAQMFVRYNQGGFIYSSHVRETLANKKCHTFSLCCLCTCLGIIMVGNHGEIHGFLLLLNVLLSAWSF